MLGQFILVSLDHTLHIFAHHFFFLLYFAISCPIAYVPQTLGSAYCLFTVVLLLYWSALHSVHFFSSFKPNYSKYFI